MHYLRCDSSLPQPTPGLGDHPLESRPRVVSLVVVHFLFELVCFLIPTDIGRCSNKMDTRKYDGVVTVIRDSEGRVWNRPMYL